MKESIIPNSYVTLFSLTQCCFQKDLGWIQQQKSPIKKWAKNLNRHFSTKNIQMVNKQTKRCLHFNHSFPFPGAVEVKVLSGLRKGKGGWHIKERDTLCPAHIHFLSQPSTTSIVATFSKPLIMGILQASVLYPLCFWPLICGLINKFMK